MSRKPFVVTLSLLLVLAWLVFPRGIDPAAVRRRACA